LHGNLVTFAIGLIESEPLEREQAGVIEEGLVIEPSTLALSGLRATQFDMTILGVDFEDA